MELPRDVVVRERRELRDPVVCEVERASRLTKAEGDLGLEAAEADLVRSQETVREDRLDLLQTLPRGFVVTLAGLEGRQLVLDRRCALRAERGVAGKHGLPEARGLVQIAERLVDAGLTLDQLDRDAPERCLFVGLARHALAAEDRGGLGL